MRIYAICPRCAEVRPAEIDCPACDGVPAHEPRWTPPEPRVAPVGRALPRVSAVVVGAYVVAVLALLVAALVQS
jgi:hypothetical protein